VGFSFLVERLGRIGYILIGIIVVSRFSGGEVGIDYWDGGI
jgi:hypothetical protein